MKTRTIWIIVIVVLVLLIGVGIYTYIQNNKAVVTPPGTPPVNTGGTDLISVISGLFSRLFKPKEPLPPFVQTPPIDDAGCDANGFNKLGFRCL